MRDIALTLIFIGILTQALRYTWVGALLWTWFSLMNPHRLTYSFAYDLPFAAVAAGATLLSILWSKGRVRLPPDPTVVMLVLFAVWTCITTVLAIYPDRSVDDLIRTLKIQLMTLVCIAALRERKHIELFIWVNVLSIGFYGVKGGLFGIATGGSARVWGPSSSFIEGNNEVGLALVMIIPLMNYLRGAATRPWIRASLLASMSLSAVAVLSTQSRGAFLAIVAMGLVMWLRSAKKVMGAIGIVGASVLLLLFMPASWEARMQTIGEYQVDSSAQGRINAWTTAVNVANDRITGAGFYIETRDIFERYAPNPEAVYTAHSIYFQALGEHGWIGLFLFVSLGALSFLTASSLRRQALARPETAWLHDLAGMVQVSMVGYAVGGAFLSLTYFDLPYNIMVMLVAAKYWLKEGRWQTETTGAFGSTSVQRMPQALPANVVVKA